MKRNAISLLVLIILVSLFAIPTFATSNTYELPELGLELSIPSTYDVITQDTPVTSPVFNRFGTSGQELIDQFKASFIYLNAIPTDSINEEIVVTMTDGVYDNLSAFSDTTIKTLASSIINEYKNYGMSVSEYDVYQHSQAKFIMIYFTDTTNSVHGLQFYTIYGAKAMNFTMRSYSGELSKTQEETIKSIVDSIKYDTAPVLAPSVPPTDSFVYTDTETNTKFTVPANWYSKELFEDREFIDVKFASGKEEGLSIMYGSTDLWSQMSESEKYGYSRSDFDSSLFTVDDMKEYFGVDANNISKITYNGIDYFIAEQRSKYEMYGTEFIVEMTRVVRFHNGWLYEFQFGGTKENKWFSDFESLLKSVQYPTVSDVGAASSVNNTTSNNSNKKADDNSGIIAVIVLLVIVAIIVVTVIVSRKKNSEPTNYTPIYNTPTPEPSSKPESAIYCTKCGQTLPLDSDFCHKCGTKIDKEDNTK